MILGDIARALGQIGDPRFRRVLLMGLGLTVALLLAAYVATVWVVAWLLPDTATLPVVGEVAFLDELAAGASLVAVMVLSVFLMVPVASAFTGIFLDEVADAVIEERHVIAAVRAFAVNGTAQDSPGLVDRAMNLATARSFAANRMRSRTEERAPAEHYPAPHALIDLWDRHHGDRDAMQTAEIKSFAGLLSTDTARNLLRVFRLRGQLKSGLADADDIGHVHVVGAGEMGGAIAGWCAMRGKRVTVSDPDWSQMAEAMPITAALCKDKHLSSIATRDTLDRLIPDPKGHGLAHADLVIEAGPENAGAKAAIYAEVEPMMNPTAILATNTSSLSLAKLSEGLRRPTRFAGLHFFNPVGKMPLVEVVRTDQTYGTVADTLAAFSS